jgi:hypothetical protein
MPVSHTLGNLRTFLVINKSKLSQYTWLANSQTLQRRSLVGRYSTRYYPLTPKLQYS